MTRTRRQLPVQPVVLTPQEITMKMLRESYNKMLLTKKETAQELSISEATLDRIRGNGDIEPSKVLGQIMFSISEVARYLADA